MMNSSCGDEFDEVRLSESSKEREQYENLADLYAIVNTLQHLEKAYIRDCVTAREYNASCSKLLAQYKVAFEQVRNNKQISTIEDFVKRYKLDCALALQRIKEGKPITIQTDTSSSKYIADLTLLFLTAVDHIKLDMLEVETLYPDLRDLLSTMDQMQSLGNFEGKKKINDWLAVLSKMQAADRITETQAKQLEFDLKDSYDTFRNMLNN